MKPRIEIAREAAQCRCTTLPVMSQNRMEVHTDECEATTARIEAALAARESEVLDAACRSLTLADTQSERLRIALANRFRTLVRDLGLE